MIGRFLCDFITNQCIRLKFIFLTLLGDSLACWIFVECVSPETERLYEGDRYFYQEYRL